MQNTSFSTTAARFATLILGALFVPAGVQAQTAADVAGYWNVVSFGTPSGITTQTDNGVVTSVNERSNFYLAAGYLSITSQGVVSGQVNDPISATIAPSGQGLLNLSQSGEPDLTFCINTGLDVMSSARKTSGGSDQEFNLLLKAPSTLANSDVNGTWTIYSLRTPASLMEIKNGQMHLTGWTARISSRLGRAP